MPEGIDVYRLRVYSTVGGVECQNVLHFVGVNDLQPNNPPVMAQFVLNNFATNIMPTWLSFGASDYFLTGLSCRQITDDGGPSIKRAFGTTQQGKTGFGSGSTCDGPLLLAYGYYEDVGKISWRTAKVFLPGTPAVYLVQGLLTTLYAFLISAVPGVLNARYVSGDLSTQYVIWTPGKKIYRVPAFWEFSQRVGVQRSRCAFKV